MFGLALIADCVRHGLHTLPQGHHLHVCSNVMMLGTRAAHLQETSELGDAEWELFEIMEKP